MIRVGIDTQSTLGFKTGIGYYTYNLIEEYKSIGEIQCILYQDLNTPQLNTLRRIYWENISLPRLIKKTKPDIVHIPGFAGQCLKKGFKKVTTVHDLIGLIYPQNLGIISRFYWQKWLPFCIKNSDFIIADSQNTKNDIIKLLGIPEEKIKVIYLSVSPAFKPIDKKTDFTKNILKKYGINSKYILNVGTIEPRKNIPGLISAFAMYLKESKEDSLILVIAGSKGWDYNRCLRQAQELGFSNKIIFCDYIDDADLPVLYNLAEVFIYPSFYEGFGLPVLEAMNCGTAVICSNKASLPEIAGTAAAYIDPENINSIKDAIKKIASNVELRQTMKDKSLQQAAKFSWGETAKQTIEVYKKILSQRK